MVSASVFGWLISFSAISQLQSVFQLGVGLNLVALGYAERRLSFEQEIEDEINHNIDSLNLLHHRFDRIIDVTDRDWRREHRSEVDSTIQKKWDVIQIGVISTRVNNNYYRLRYRFHRSDTIYRALMFAIAVLCCVGLFATSLTPWLVISDWLSVALCLISIAPAIVRFYHASKQASVYRRFMVGDRPKPDSDKLADRHARVNRSIEEERIIFAKRLDRSPNGFKPDDRYVSVAEDHSPTALYFVSGQIRSRIKTLSSSI